MPLSPILILKSTIDNYLKSSVDFFDGFIADLGFSGDFIPHDVCFLFNSSGNAILTVFALLWN